MIDGTFNLDESRVTEETCPTQADNAELIAASCELLKNTIHLEPGLQRPGTVKNTLTSSNDMNLSGNSGGPLIYKFAGGQLTVIDSVEAVDVLTSSHDWIISSNKNVV